MRSSYRSVRVFLPRSPFRGSLFLYFSPAVGRTQTNKSKNCSRVLQYRHLKFGLSDATRMPDGTSPLPTTVNFDYIKTAQFRVLHADGAYLSLTFQGGVVLSFFSERQPIPRRVVHQVRPDGSLGDEIVEQRVVRDAVVRDTEVAVSMTFDTAKRIQSALNDLIIKIEELKPKEPGK